MNGSILSNVNVTPFPQPTDFSNYAFSTVFHKNVANITWDDATWILTSSFIIFTMQSGTVKYS